MNAERKLRLFAAAGLASFAAAILLVAFAGGHRRRPAPQNDKPAQLVALIREERSACAAAWPGYDALSRPLLLAFDGGSILMDASRAPFGFLAEPDRRTWTSRRLYQPPFLFDLDYVLDGTRVTALRVSKPWDAASFASLFYHERFHGYQSERFKEIPSKPYTVEDARDVALAASEDYALGHWVWDGTADAVRDFAALRLRRRALFPATAAEEFQERLEGTAKYVELAGVEFSSSPAVARQRLLDRLVNRTWAQDLPKFRAYGVGAALCRWLQAQRVPGWQRQIELGRTPAELVLRRLKLSPAEAARRVGAFTATPRYRGFEDQARRSLKILDERRAATRKRFDELPGLRLVLTGGAAEAAFSGNWVDYPDGSSLLVASEWVVDRPEIKVRLRDDKGVLRLPKTQEARFVVPPEAVIRVDGARWRPKPGRLAFRRLEIRDQRISLSAGPGRLDDDGTFLRLSFPGAR